MDESTTLKTSGDVVFSKASIKSGNTITIPKTNSNSKLSLHRAGSWPFTKDMSMKLLISSIDTIILLKKRIKGNN